MADNEGTSKKDSLPKDDDRKKEPGRNGDEEERKKRESDWTTKRFLAVVRDLTPNSKRVNVLAKVLSVGQLKEVLDKFGEPRKVAEVVIGDDTATITLNLWNEQIGTIQKDEVILVDNGYVSLVRGHMRLNVGPHGVLRKATKEIGRVNEMLDMSQQEFETER